MNKNLVLVILMSIYSTCAFAEQKTDQEVLLNCIASNPYFDDEEIVKFQLLRNRDGYGQIVQVSAKKIYDEGYFHFEVYFFQITKDGPAKVEMYIAEGPTKDRSDREKLVGATYTFDKDPIQLNYRDHVELICTK